MPQRIYRHPKHPTVDLPALDLLSLLFDSELSVAQDATILHQEAADPTNTINKAQTRELTELIAHGLRHQYGVGSGGPNKDVVTVMSYGQILIPTAFYGVIAAGGVYSAASPSSTVSELARQISTADSKLVICSIEHVDVVSKAASECGLPLSQVLVLQSSPTWSFRSLEGDVDVLSKDRLPWEKITDPKLLRESLITILWSSGTTGLPKGVMLSHTNLVAETYITAMSSREWVEKEVANGTFVPSEYRALAHLPISHIAGLFGYFIGPIYSGGTVIWMNRYRWDDMLKYLKQYKITAFYTVPSIWLRISKAKEVTDHFQYVEGAATGAAPMDGQLQYSASSVLGDKSGELSVGQTWGLSETTGAVTAVPKGEKDVSGSIGSILPSVEVRMVDDDFNDVEEGKEGEMVLRTPLVTNGYYKNEKATREAFHDGWFCTGDIAVRRNGKFFIVDRKKELLKYKGLQVAPAEIENLLFSHDKIREAAVIGVPAPEDPTTDLPRAYVVAVQGSNLTEDAVKGFVKDRLAPYKQLRGGVVFVDEIPKSAVGKILRRELRDRAKKETELRARL